MCSSKAYLCYGSKPHPRLSPTSRDNTKETPLSIMIPEREREGEVWVICSIVTKQDGTEEQVKAISQ